MSTSSTTPLRAATIYKRRGHNPIPVPAREKNPNRPGWEKLVIAADDLPQFFNGAAGNVGLLLGKLSAGLVDVDLDASEAVCIGRRLLPPTPMRHGRPGKPESHWWYHAPGAKTKQYEFTESGQDKPTSLAELRSTGCQTIVPPSIHPTGEQLAWERFGTPATIDPAVLLRQVTLVSAGALLARHWPGQGSRDKVAMALCGMLAKAGWTGEQIDALVLAVAEAAGDEEWQDRAKGARTAERIADGEAVWGTPKLVELLRDGERVVKKVREWLGLRIADDYGNGASGTKTTAPARKVAIIPLVADAILARGERFAVDASGALWHYRAGVYQPHGDTVVRRLAKELLLGELAMPEKWSTHLADEIVAFLAVDAPQLWERPPEDRVNVQNGILSWRSRTLAPHSPEFLSPVQLGARYDPAARCPAIDAFVGQVFPDDAQQLAWELLAWLMVPSTDIQKAALLLGEGGNGKSTYLALCEAFLGKRNTSALPLQKLEADRFAAARLVGKLANICADLPSEALAGTSMFKAITGGDVISGERKFHESFDFTPFARLVFSANTPPRSPDASTAFYDRWIAIPFGGRFRGAAGEVPRRELDARLSAPAELSGALNRALDALPQLVKTARFSPAASVEQALRDFREVTDPFSIWLDVATTADPFAVTLCSALRSAYAKHCLEVGGAPMSDTALTQALKRARPHVDKKQRTVDDRVQWCYLGIGLGSQRPPDPSGGPSGPSQPSQLSQLSPSLVLPSAREEKTVKKAAAGEAKNEREQDRRKVVKVVKPVNREQLEQRSGDTRESYVQRVMALGVPRAEADSLWLVPYHIPRFLERWKREHSNGNIVYDGTEEESA